jgi:hypothetical protein
MDFSCILSETIFRSSEHLNCVRLNMEIVLQYKISSLEYEPAPKGYVKGER